MKKKGTIDILVTDDHPLFRRCLRTVLQTRSDMKVVGEAENGQVAVSKVRELCPDIVLMDIDMPVLGGIDATRRIKEECNKTIVIALSNQSDEAYVQAMLNAGATDYVSKCANSIELERSIRQAYSKRDTDA